MTREEILNEIDDTLAFFRSAKVKVGETLTHARNVVAKKGSEEAYNKGLEDAWEFVRKTITAVNPQEAYKLLDFFGVANYRDIYKEYTPQEALAKLEAYEKEHAENIKVGDVVKSKYGECIGVVVKIYGNGCYVLFDDGSAGSQRIDGFEKTGKHIDIQSVLEQIGGAE